MNNLGWLWLGFLGIWKAVPGKVHNDPNLWLGITLWLGIALLIFGHKERVPNGILVGVTAMFLLAAFARYELETSQGNAFTGPYAILDHPIYTAVGIAAAITALHYRNLQAYTGAGAVIAALILKAMEEENGV